MPNYKLEYGVSEVAKILKVDRNLIKTWTFSFSDYLNKNANPKKGIERQYTIDDICVFNYIYMYWEDNPDLESIKTGLNRQEHQEYPYNEIKTETTPIFRELSEKIIGDEFFFAGGLFGGINKLDLADSYKNAGDLLVESILNNKDNDSWGIFFPVIFNYRHSTELYLKVLIEEENITHDLKILFEKFKGILKNEFNESPPDWFENIINTFNDFDEKGTTFRYGNLDWENEIIIDLRHIKKLMNRLSEFLHLVNDKRNKNK